MSTLKETLIGLIKAQSTLASQTARYSAIATAFADIEALTALHNDLRIQAKRASQCADNCASNVKSSGVKELHNFLCGMASKDAMPKGKARGYLKTLDQFLSFYGLDGAIQCSFNALTQRGIASDHGKAIKLGLATSYARADSSMGNKDDRLTAGKLAEIAPKATKTSIEQAVNLHEKARNAPSRLLKVAGQANALATVKLVAPRSISRNRDKAVGE